MYQMLTIQQIPSSDHNGPLFSVNDTQMPDDN